MTPRARFGLAVVLCLIGSTAFADANVTSREYHIKLKPSDFSYGQEAADVQSLIGSVKTAVQAAIDRDVTGTPTLDHQRQVQYFDTPGCELRKLGYSFRNRVEGGDSQVSLKFRGPDRYISGFEDVSSSQSGAKTKLESDISATTDDPFKVVYSHSTNVPNTRTINKVKDIDAYFPGFKDDYDLNEDTALNPVSGLSIAERVYEDVYIDLGQDDAEISVTLWYKTDPSVNPTPLVAELSFRYKDSKADYTRKVVNRARQSFDAIRGLSAWVNPEGESKTTFVYDYESGFCQSR